MKIKYSIILVSIFTLISTSCNDFLNVKGQGKPDPSTYPQLASDLVVGAYNGLLEGDPFGYGDVHGFAFISATNIMSDDADKGSTSLDQASTTGQFDEFTLSTSNQFCETLWTGHYNAIGNTNKALAALAALTPTQMDPALKYRYYGEMRFLRAYLYFNLVRMYGGVPLVLRVAADATDAASDTFTKRADASVVYDSIINDLTFAQKHLPLKSAAEAPGRATKGAAQGLLSKVYLYKENWAQAFAWSDSVINSGQYSLVADYALQFRQAGNNGPESLFEIQTGTFNNAPLRIDNYTDSQGPRATAGWNDLGWGFNDPSVSLINSYEVGDLRKDATIIFIDNSGTHKGTILWDGFRIPSSDSVQNLYYNYKTYTSSTDPFGPHGSTETYTNPSDKDRAKNVIILRYADVLLINAEAAVQLGSGDALTPINLIRQRAGLSTKGSVTLADIKQERHVELAMEDDRFWDLVRWGDAETVMHAAGKTNYMAGRNELLPIPLIQILLSGNKLKQNPNY
ncbi:MAG: RagB/SusD family nutrient uptake outer membrane protein [Cyclobacteriaceae bacterium]